MTLLYNISLPKRDVGGRNCRRLRGKPTRRGFAGRKKENMENKRMISLLDEIRKEKVDALKCCSRQGLFDRISDQIEAIDSVKETIQSRKVSPVIFQLIDFYNEYEHIDAMMCGDQTDWYDVYISLRVLSERISEIRLNQFDTDFNFLSFSYRNLSQLVVFERDRIRAQFGETFEQ